MILCMMTVLCAAAMTGCGTKTVKDSDVVMEIAGQDVVKAEYQMILADYVAEIKQQYDTETANRKDFWTAEQEGKRPLDKIMQLAGENLTEKKVIAQLAKESESAAVTDYLSIAAQMGEENDRRQTAEETGEVVYGLTSYDVREYYNYVYTQIEYEMVETLKQQQDISEEELKQIYEENQQEYTSDVGVKVLVAEMLAETGMEKAAQIAEAMGTDTDVTALTSRYPDVSFYEMELSSLNTQEGKNGAYMERWLTASMMQPGEVCTPFSIGEKLMVMRCIERSEHVVQPFADVKGVLKDHVQTNLAYEEIESREKETEIQLVVSEKQLEQAALEALE